MFEALALLRQYSSVRRHLLRLPLIVPALQPTTAAGTDCLRATAAAVKESCLACFMQLAAQCTTAGFRHTDAIHSPGLVDRRPLPYHLPQLWLLLVAGGQVRSICFSCASRQHHLPLLRRHLVAGGQVRGALNVAVECIGRQADGQAASLECSI